MTDWETEKADQRRYVQEAIEYFQSRGDEVTPEQRHQIAELYQALSPADKERHWQRKAERDEIDEMWRRVAEKLGMAPPAP